jgi:hypothetical protein
METALSIDEGLKLAPGSEVLELPRTIETAGHIHVWESLYRWVHGRLPDTDLERIPSAVVVGEEAMHELLLAEQTRLKDIGLIGEQLEQALRSSLREAGPNTLLESRPLEGRWLLVRPSVA